MSIPPFFQINNPLKDLLGDIKQLIRWPQSEVSFRPTEFNSPVKTVYEKIEKSNLPLHPVNDSSLPLHQKVDFQLQPHIEEIARQITGVCEFNFPVVEDSFANLKQIVPLPDYHLLPTIEPQGFQKALLGFFRQPHNVSVSDQLSRYLNYLEQTAKVPQEYQGELSAINQKLRYYAPVQCPSQEMLQSEYDYYHFDPKSFSEKVLNNLPKGVLASSRGFQELAIARKARELAPIHPALIRYLPPVMLKDKNAALAFTRLIEGVQQKIAFLEQTNQLHLLEHGEELKQMLQEGISRSGKWVKDLLFELYDPVRGINETDRKKLDPIEGEIAFGLVHVQAEIQERNQPEEESWKKMGKAIFGKAFRLRPPFALTEASQLPAFHSAAVLPHLEGMDLSLAKMASYALSPDADSAFTAEDFNSPSAILKVNGKPLLKGKLVFVNGVANNTRHAQNSANFVSQMSDGTEVTVIYNGSQGLAQDIMESFYHLHHYSTTPVKQLLEEVQLYFEKEGEEAQMLITCHSQGTIVTRNALMQLPPAIRNRISVLAVAPAAYIDRYLCGSVLHLVSKRDWLVPWIDWAGRQRCKESIVYLDCKSWSLLDHAFSSPTYAEFIERTNQKFVNENI